MQKGEVRGEVRGVAKGKRELIIKLGTKRFGKPTRTMAAALNRIDSDERLDELGEKILDAGSWAELLA